LELPDCPTPDGRRKKKDDDDDDDKCAIATVTRSDSNVLLPNTAITSSTHPQIEHQVNSINKNPSFLLQQQQQQSSTTRTQKSPFSSLSHLVLHHTHNPKPHMISKWTDQPWVRRNCHSKSTSKFQIHMIF
jgi:hypothetical protein